MTTSAKDFHRLSAVFPADYYGGTLPADHDWINDPASNGDDGFAALIIADANSKRLGGPNEGTYFVGFGDDANAGNFNRGLAALAQNTDYIDNILNRKIAIPQRADAAAPGAPVSSLNFSAGTYIEGWSTDAASIDRLFSIVNDDDEEIIVSGSKVRITTLTGPGPSDVWASGSFTATVSPAIPTGVAYRVYYGVAGRLASLPRDAFTSIKVRGAEEVSAKVENLFRLLQGNNYEWDTTPWEGSTSIYSLVHRGLYGLYSRDPVYIAEVPRTDVLGGVYPTALDTAGSGAWFLLTGPGMCGLHSTDGMSYADLYTDGFAAIWKAVTDASLESNYVQSGMSVSDALNTNIGFLYLGQKKSGATAAEMSGAGGLAPGFASFFAGAVNIHDSAAAGLYTRIDGNTACTLSVSGDDIQVVLGATTSYFTSGLSPNIKSGIAEGTDMLLIQRNSDSSVRTYIITEVVSSTTVKCRALDGGSPADFTGACKVLRWIRPYYMVGDGATQFREWALDATNDIKLRNFMVLQPPKNHASAFIDALDSGYNGAANAYFGAATKDSTTKALVWGGYTLNGTTGQGSYSFPYYLAGNGDVLCSHVVASKGFSQYTFYHDITDTSTEVLDASVLPNHMIDINTTGNINLQFTNLKKGSEFHLYFRRRPGSYAYAAAQYINFGAAAPEDEDSNVLTLLVEDGLSGTYILPPPGVSDEIHIFKCTVLFWGFSNTPKYLIISHESVSAIP